MFVYLCTYIFVYTTLFSDNLKFLVVNGSSVVASYHYIEDAKERLSKIITGSRLIAEVDENGALKRDPHLVNGQNQTPENGFNKWWTGWTDINRMMDVCERYLQLLNGITYITHVCMLRYIYIYI